MITITDKAKNKIKELVANRPDGNTMIRVGVSTSGCGGYAYQLEWTKDLEVEDVIVRDNDTELLLNKKWSSIFFGVTLDYKKEGLNEGFDFVNPNEKARCGCGESFSI